MQFTNPAVAEKFTMTGDKDQTIHIPGRYSGKLSEVNDPEIIAGMIKRKSNLVAEKSGTPKPPAGSPKPNP